MESDQTKGCCNWKVISIIIGCVEILLSIGFGFIFGASNAVFGEYQTAIVIFLICFLNVIASIIWLRGIALNPNHKEISKIPFNCAYHNTRMRYRKLPSKEEIKFLLTAVVWWVASLSLWLLWMILDVISGVDLDKTIIITTALILISHLTTALCFVKLRAVFLEDETEDPQTDVTLRSTVRRM